jgi:hypothetical protein
MFCSKEKILLKLKEFNLDRGTLNEAFEENIKEKFTKRVGFALNFISAIFIIGLFLSLFHELFLKSEIFSLFFGIVISTIIYFLDEELKDKDLADSFLIVAQLLILFGVSRIIPTYTNKSFFLLVSIIEVLFIFLFKNRFSQLFASAVATYSFAHFLTGIKAEVFALEAIFLLFIFLTIKQKGKFDSILEGVTLSFIILFFLLYPKPSKLNFLESFTLIGTTFYLFFFLSKLKLKEIFLLFLAILPLFALSLWVKGLAIFLTFLILGFGFAIWEIFGIGVLGVVGSISLWYYNLEITLTQKSFLMITTGIFLILIGIFINQFLKGEENAK